MSIVEPEKLVVAVRLIYRHGSVGMGNPEAAAAVAAASGAPVSWVEEFVARKGNFAKNTAIRFLAAAHLPTPEEGRCTLCAERLSKPARTWHKDCWKAFEPHTARAWNKLRRMAFKRCKNACEKCQASVWLSAHYQVDHILAICLGGTNVLANLQVLCLDCHKEKSKADLKARRNALALR